MRKRLFDIVFAGAGLIVFSPIFLLLAILVRLGDGGPALFRQQRVGQGGRLFWILKFRTMVLNAQRLGLSVTKDGDPRITPFGQFLRKSKLDELPQLWNVFRGEMSLVGPRPEMPCYVAQYLEEQKRVLALKPGITDLATLEFRHEEELLLGAADTERFYLEHCVPHKIELNLAYAKSAGLWQDTKIILRTLGLLRYTFCSRWQRAGATFTEGPLAQPSGPHNTLQGFRRQVWWPALRLILLVGAYASVLIGSRWLAYQLRFDFAVPASARGLVFRNWLWVLCAEVIFLAGFRQFSGVTRYFSLPDIKHLLLAMAGSGLFLCLLRGFESDFYCPPRGVILVECLLGFGGLCAMRLAYRRLHERRWSRHGKAPGQLQYVAIVGAGDVGSSLVLELNHRPGLGLNPVVFLDDNSEKWHSYLHGVPVAGPIESLSKWAQNCNLSKVIIAMPSAPAKRVAMVAKLAQQHGLSCVIMPAVDQLTSGQLSVSQLRPISIEDLLGRDPVPLETESIRETFENQVVMVTGAGGSIGSELCRQIAACGPQRLLLVERCEVQLFQIEQELIKRGHGGMIVPLAADILDQVRMRTIFQTHRPAVVLHAAAHKHVPMMEHQPSEAVLNNSIGSARLADLAVAFGVERFLMISTDKAVNPTSVMGASKRLAEIYLQALFAQHPHATKFICVRFGNVLGSSGSVVPTFARQIAAGGPVTVTHPNMVRYFMTIPEAVGLVLQSCAQGAGGEIFVLDMGQPVRIAALARQMIGLSGLTPDLDIEIKYVGLRPGEKLFEELHCQGENFRPTRHPRIMSFVHQPEPLAQVYSALTRLEEEMYSLETAALRSRIRRLVPEYVPYKEEESFARVTMVTPGVPGLEAALLSPATAPFPGPMPAALAGA